MSGRASINFLSTRLKNMSVCIYSKYARERQPVSAKTMSRVSYHGCTPLPSHGECGLPL